MSEGSEFLVLSACKSFYESAKDDPTANSIKDALIHVLSFMWAMSKLSMVRAPHELPSNGEILSWANRLHASHIRPTSMPPPNPSEIEGPSSAAWGQMTQSMSEVNQALKNQFEDKRLERNEKKDEWAKILVNHRDVILNFSTKDRKNAALSPSKELLEVMN